MPPRSQESTINFADEHHQKHPLETDDLIENALKDFEYKIEQIPAGEKKCLLDAQCKCPELLTDDFKLMFLRTDVFQVDLAAKRYVKYWENRVDLFGVDKAFLPLNRAGAMMDDQEYHSIGYIRTVPGHERLLIVDPSRGSKKSNIDALTRSCVVTVQQALEASEEMQKKGSICILDLGKATFYHHAFVKRFTEVTNDSFPLRCSLFCIVNAPPGVGFFVKIFKLFLKPRMKNRLYVIKDDAQLQELAGIAMKDVYPNLDPDK